MQDEQVILENLLLGPSNLLRLQSIMLINTLCSDSLGREYVISNLTIIQHLLQIGKQQKEDNNLLKNSLAAL